MQRLKVSIKMNLILNIMKGCDILSNTKKLYRLEQTFSNLQEEQREYLAKIRQKQRDLKKEIEAERYAFISRAIKQTGFPLDKPILLVGAILAAKEKLDSKDCAEEINHFISLYNDFAKNHNLVIPNEDTDSTDLVDFTENEKEVITDDADTYGIRE